jgi:type IV pilus assembly protein PilW
MHLISMPRSRRSAAGLTLIELMIAITVALVLLAAMAVMYGSSIKARNQIENGRHAIQLLRDDLQMAGFMGEFNMLDLGPDVPPAVPDFCVTHLTTQGALPADAITDDLTTNGDVTGDGLVNGLDYLAASLALRVQGVDDADAGTLPACLTGAAVDVRAGTDVIVLRRLLSCSTTDAGCGFQAGAPYMQASQCNAELNIGIMFRLRADADTAAFTLRRRTCIAGALTPIRRFVTHIYYVANNNLAGDGIPTLKRRELINTGFTTTALVEGIEDLQFEYGIDGVDADGNPVLPLDGSPDVYVDLPADAWEWANSRTVRVHLLSRATEARPGYVDRNTYTLGSKTIAEPADAFTRQVFQTVVQFHNAPPPPPAPTPSP